MAENKGSAAAPRGWDVAETSVPGNEGLLQEVTGREGQRDSTLDRDPTNDRYRDAEWRKAAAEDRAEAIEANFERNIKPELGREDLSVYQRQQSTQERVAEAVRDVRAGNVGVTKAMSQLQEKLDERSQDRGQQRDRGGRDR